MLSARDAEPLYYLIDYSRDYLNKWLPWINNYQSEEDCLEFIKGSIYMYNNRTAIISGVYMREDLVGVVGFNQLNFQHKHGSIGYWIGKQYQGQGLITQSVSALISYGFTELNLNRVEIRCAANNKKSQEIPKRLGFQREGYLREIEWLHDHFVDHIVYSLINPNK